MLRAGLFIACLLLVAHDASAQVQRTEHTLGLDKPDARPAATLEDVAMLVGSWTGTAFGSEFEASWHPPSAGSMVGLFKLLGDEGVNFYEILLLVEEEGSLSLKVKHFSPHSRPGKRRATTRDFDSSRPSKMRSISRASVSTGSATTS